MLQMVWRLLIVELLLLGMVDLMLLRGLFLVNMLALGGGLLVGLLLLLVGGLRLRLLTDGPLKRLK